MEEDKNNQSKFNRLKLVSKSKEFLGKIKIPKKNKNFDQKLVLNLSKSRIPNFKQLKQLPKILSDKEKKTILSLLIIAIISFGFLSVEIYKNHIIEKPDYYGKYTEGLIGSPKYINPVLSQTNDVDTDLSRLVFSSLFKYSPGETVIPDLVASYEISNEQKTYTFVLRDDAYWHDGEKLDVNDVIFTIETIQNPSFKSPLSSSLQGVSVEKVDDHTFRLNLAEPFAPFLDILTFGILPEHVWNNIPANNISLVEYNLKPLGSGPFKFKSLTKDKSGNLRSYILVRNEDYYSKKPYLEEITFKFYPDFESAIAALKNKNIEGISYLPREYIKEVKPIKTVKNYSLNLPQYTALFFNPKSNENLKDRDLREALSLAIDKEKILQEVLDGEGLIIHGPILPDFLGYHEGIKKYEYNPGRSAEILEEKGWEIDENLKRTKDDEELKITLTIIDQPTNIKAAELIKNFWQDVGIQTEINIVAKNIFQKEIIKTRSYEVLLFSEIVGADPDPYPFWHSSQVESPGLNLSLYANKRVDDLIEEARQTSNIELRKKDYIQFQDILAEEIPAIFLYSPVYTYALDVKIKNFGITRISIPADRFNNINDWYIKTKKTWTWK